MASRQCRVGAVVVRSSVITYGPSTETFARSTVDAVWFMEPILRENGFEKSREHPHVNATFRKAAVLSSFAVVRPKKYRRSSVLTVFGRSAKLAHASALKRVWFPIARSRQSWIFGRKIPKKSHVIPECNNLLSARDEKSAKPLLLYIIGALFCCYLFYVRPSFCSLNRNSLFTVFWFFHCPSPSVSAIATSTSVRWATHAKKKI